MAGKKTAIEVRGLSKVFITEGRKRVPVFDDLNLSVIEGEFVALLGPTGCGKTTLLRILLGMENVTAGRVLVAGEAPREGRALAGAVFQQNSLFPWKKVIHNVSFPLEMKGMTRSQARLKARELLQMVRLEASSRAYPYELSGGMQQRASIARALAQDAGILLMDEPFGALDDQTRRVLQRVLLDIWKVRGMTLLFVTHNIEEALVLGSRVLVMGRGRILYDEKVDLPRPRDPLSDGFAAQLLSLRAFFAEAINAAD